jgi:predicted component of type VI protein secretion system
MPTADESPNQKRRVEIVYDAALAFRTRMETRLAQKKDQLAQKKDQLAVYRDQLTLQRQDLAAQRDELAAQRDLLAVERDLLAVQRARLDLMLMCPHDAAPDLKSHLRGAVDGLLPTSTNAAREAAVCYAMLGKQSPTAAAPSVIRGAALMTRPSTSVMQQTTSVGRKLTSIGL